MELFKLHVQLDAETLHVEVKLILPQDASIPQKSAIWTLASDQMARPAPTKQGKRYRTTMCIFKGHDLDEEKAL